MRVSLVILLAAAFPGTHSAPAADVPRGREVETLIEQLTEVSEVGVGYTDFSAGSEFLPQPGSGQNSMLVLGSPPPRRSRIVEGLVRAGVAAVPHLLKHLDDGRKTAIPPVSGMIWTEFNNRPDSNRRTRRNPAPREAEEDRSKVDSKEHQLTVGDLCFVALGQIVNRGFSASRYQPTGGLIITSPTQSRPLCEALREEFAGFTEEAHRKLLRDDFQTPDHPDRRLGSYRRLAFYYPDEVEGLVLKQMAVPTYDVFAVHAFVRDTLYREASAARQKVLLGRFLTQQGRTGSDGVLLHLFDDLDMQEADETGRLFAPLERKYHARELLVDHFGFPPGVKSSDRPYIKSWAAHEKARYIGALTCDDNKRIDAEVARIFRGIKDDDYLALACMGRLVKHGFTADARIYCERRVAVSEQHARALREMLVSLGEERRSSGIPENSQEPANSRP